jgi:hypothetical protein
MQEQEKTGSQRKSRGNDGQAKRPRKKVRQCKAKIVRKNTLHVNMRKDSYSRQSKSKEKQ